MCVFWEIYPLRDKSSILLTFIVTFFLLVKLAFLSKCDGNQALINNMNINDYIKKTGKAVINRDLGIPISTLSKWQRLQKAPRPLSAARLIEYSDGLLSWSSIYQPYIEKNRAENEYK